VAGQLSAFDILVTDSSAPSEPLAELEATGVEVRRV
jgi:DeoR/GlpR family transcriptional regulator of sugar metabolism